MARTTAALVAGILRGDYDGTSDLLPFIATATNLVTRAAAMANDNGEPLTTDEQEIIERWLAAHFYGSTYSNDRPIQEQHTESAWGIFQGRTGQGLESTYYGQMALAADPSGSLAAITKRVRARAAWLGKNPSAQTPYNDRR